MDSSQLGKKLGTFTIDWLYFAILFFVLGLIGWLAVREVYGIRMLWPYILLVIVLYYALMFALRQLRPRIHLYEEGLVVMEGGFTELFSWKDLTHFEGERHTNYVNFIPVWRTGANVFFAGDAPAFRVGAMTNWADILVDYCLSHMAEQHIPAMEEAVRSEKAVHIDMVDVKQDGIGNPEAFIEWDKVQDIWLAPNIFESGYIVKVKTAVEGKSLTFDLWTLRGIDAYILLALVDRITGRGYLPRMRELIAHPHKRLELADKSGLAVVIGAIVLLIAGIIAFAVLYNTRRL